MLCSDRHRTSPFSRASYAASISSAPPEDDKIHALSGWISTPRRGKLRCVCDKLKLAQDQQPVYGRPVGNLARRIQHVGASRRELI